MTRLGAAGHRVQVDPHRETPRGSDALGWSAFRRLWLWNQRAASLQVQVVDGRGHLSHCLFARDVALVDPGLRELGGRPVEHRDLVAHSLREMCPNGRQADTASTPPVATPNPATSLPLRDVWGFKDSPCVFSTLIQPGAGAARRRS